VSIIQPHDARTRTLLSVLGIRLWGLRELAPQVVAPAEVWGRHVVDESAPVPVVRHDTGQDPSVAVVTPVARKVIPESDVHMTQVPAQTVERAKTFVRQEPDPATGVYPADLILSDKPVDKLADTSTQRPEEPLVRFSLEARLLGEWLVLVPERVLAHSDSRQLWQSMVHAFGNPEPYRFEWPLADGKRWQRNIGVQAALAGFFARFGPRQIALLGGREALPAWVFPSHVSHLPGLDQMLKNPLEKRALWLRLTQYSSDKI